MQEIARDRSACLDPHEKSNLEDIVQEGVKRRKRAALVESLCLQPRNCSHFFLPAQHSPSFCLLILSNRIASFLVQGFFACGSPDGPDSPLAVGGEPLPKRNASIDLLASSTRLWHCCAVLLHSCPSTGPQLLGQLCWLPWQSDSQPGTR